MDLRGSCLCGAVSYQVQLPFTKFVNCHCSRCRKATGSAHAANAYVLPGAFRWTGGEKLVTRFDLPQARSFATSFCARCGSPLPHLTRSGREIVIPAGSFDEEPGVSPSSDVDWSSRAAWANPSAALPKQD